MVELNPDFNDSKGPLYCQLYQYIRDEIKNGEITVGTRLPSIRQLSTYLRVSKNTIESAYQQLLEEGYVESRPRSGLYVVEIDCEFAPLASKITMEDVNRNEDVGKYKYDFDHNAVDLSSFPFNTWKKLLNECLNIDNKELFIYDASRGENGLKKELSSYLRHSRNVYCSDEQIIIGAVPQYLISIICQFLGIKSCTVAIEDPGCIEMKSIFKNLGFTVIGIPVGKDGINIDDLKKSGAKIVYVTPSKQFPNGMIMPVAKRMKLLKWAEENGCLIIEGDYDGEFRYHGNPIPSLHGLNSNDNVIYLSTFSKYLLPSICISYMVLPNKLLNLYKNSSYIYEQTVPRVSQKVLQLFMERGYWERHIRRMRNLYSKKHKLLLDCISKYMNDKLRIIGKDAGLHLLIELDNGMNIDDLVESAKKKSVKVYPASIYYEDLKESMLPQLLLGFGGLSEADIVEGIKLLSEAWL